MRYQTLGAEFDWGGLATSFIQAGSDIVGDVTDVRQARIERDTAGILAQVRGSGAAPGAALFGEINPTLVIGGIAAVGVLAVVLLLARK